MTEPAQLHKLYVTNLTIVDIGLRIKGGIDGFNINSTNTGMGIRNIDLRLKSIDALYKWKSTINKGCCLIIIISKS